MRRSILALAVLALVADEASACGPVRGFLGRVRDRIQERRGVTQYAPAAQPRPAAFAPASDCPDGRCPLQRRVDVVPQIEPPASGLVVFETPRRMP